MTSVPQDTPRFENVYVAEAAIRDLIKNDNNCSAHFNYVHSELEKWKLALTLELVTYNPKTQTHFLLHKLAGDNKLNLLNEMHDHLFKLKYTLKNKENNYLSYTISWYNSEANQSETSFFYGRSLEEILIKFRYQKKTMPTIFSMVLNPES